MTVTLELKPEIEALVIEQAAALGLPVQEFLESVIEDTLAMGGENSFYETATEEEWELAVDDFANSSTFARAAEWVVDDSREGIYREREDSQM